MKTTLLIDADIVAYKVAAINQDDFDFGDTGSGRFVNHDRAIRDIDEIIGGYCATLGTNEVIICLSDPDRNFRKELYAGYKAKRTEIEKPELLQWAKDYMYREYRSFVRPRLEADDVMGILSTHPKLIPGRKIIVSEDKDMVTIPGYLYNPGKPERGVRHIDHMTADRALLYQTIIGDTTDGYPGCPGAGPLSPWACNLLSAESKAEMWAEVVDCYEYHGLNEQAAILQTRCAHILRSASYNFETRKVKLWKPSWLAV